MSIEISCDGKQCRSKGMDAFFCEDCYYALEAQLKEAEKRIAELEKDNEDLQK